MKFLPEYDLYICGKDSFQYADEIRTQIKEKAVGNVFVTGMIEQTEKIWLYRNCQAFLFPSRGEGFGLPVIEAMLFGKSWNRKQWQKAFGRTYPYFMNKKKKLTK